MTARNAGKSRKAEVASSKRFSIYVIRLKSAVLDVPRFREANPQFVQGKPCAYVGMTACTPDERLKQHKDGYKACSLVRRFGLHLMRRQYEHHNPMTYEEAKAMEVEKARRLRNKGFAIWQK